jgi:histidine phosphotransferase ChpT
MMHNQSLMLTQLMSAKICHDLAASVGAMGLGIEMLCESPSIDRNIQDLLESSNQGAKAKLKIFRALVSSSDHELFFPEVKQMISDLCAGEKKTHVTWSSNLCNSLGGVEAKILLGLALLSVEGLPRGGQLTIITNPLDTGYQLNGHGSIASVREDSLEFLVRGGSLSTVTSRTVLPYYIRTMAEELNVKVHYSSGGTDQFSLGASRT